MRSVSQACISKIEHREISGINVVRAYVAAPGGSIDVVARLGDRTLEGSLTGAPPGVRRQAIPARRSRRSVADLQGCVRCARDQM
jgi:hypothetical protein